MKPTDRTKRAAGQRYFKALLHFLPPAFRERHGAEVLALFTEMRNELGRHPGVLRLMRFYTAAATDVLRRRRIERAKRALRPTRALNRGAVAQRWLGELRQDTVYALRGLSRAKAFTLIAVLSLAVGIGVNTGLFTFVHATLAPVPGVNEGERVIEILSTGQGAEYEVWSYPDFHDARAADTPIEAMAGWKSRDASLTTGDGGQRVNVMYVSSNYFRVLGVAPSRGRDFLPSEDVGPGEHPVAIVSHAMWQSRLRGDSDIIGQTITLNRATYSVIGVAPEEFTGHRPLQGGVDLWVPLTQDNWIAGENNYLTERGVRWLRVLGRLRAGATVGEANAALQTVFARLAREYPETNETRAARAFPFGPIPALGRATSMMGVIGLFALLGLVLLIICGNVTGMALARSASREREISVRMALGSGRGRLVRLLMVEALVLSLAGGALGVVLAFWGSAGLMMIVPPMPDGSPLNLRPDLPILAYSLGLTLVATLAVGLIPAIRFSHPELVSSLKDDTGGGGRRVGRIHRMAASAQTGLALILLVLCSLSFRAVRVMDRRDFGFEPHNLLTTRIDLSQQGYQSMEQAGAFLDHVTVSIAAIPGVQTVSLSDGIPLDLVGNYTSVSRADRPDETAGRVLVEFTRATEGFFETIGTPMLQGRGFEARDVAASRPVAVITRSLADRLWPGEDVLGRQIRSSVTTDPAKEFTVVGVVGDVASSRPTEHQPHIFVGLRQNYSPRIMLLVKGTADASVLIRPIQAAILDVDPRLPVPQVISSESLVTRSTEGQRATAAVAAGFGLLALLLAGIGVYGVVAFTVANRRREIGVRMALGATRGRVLLTVLTDAVRLALPGLVVGSLLAVAAGFGMRSTLLGVSPMDPISFGSVAAILLSIVLLASLVPARRASSIDPMNALRSE